MTRFEIERAAYEFDFQYMTFEQEEAIIDKAYKELKKHGFSINKEHIYIVRRKLGVLVDSVAYCLEEILDTLDRMNIGIIDDITVCYHPMAR